MSSIAHLRIDEQNDFVEGGSLAVADGLAAIAAGNAINAASNYAVTISTQDWHPKNHASFASTHGSHVFASKDIVMPDGSYSAQVMWPDHCVQGEHGAEFHSTKAIYSYPHVVVQKGCNPLVDSYSGFGDAFGGKFEKTNMDDVLCKHGITKVVITGLAADYCVSFTAKDAIKKYKVCVPLWATRAVASEPFEMEKAVMRTRGVFLAKTQDELDAWLIV